MYVRPDYADHMALSFGVLYDDVEATIKTNPDAKAVFLINPTYYGAATDLKRIVDLAHSHGMVVLVDEAHGAHLHFHDELPLSAMEAGADMAAVSLHKTGGSLTQSSGLLLKSERIQQKHVRKILNLNQTTSASYLLMSSLDVARKNLATNGKNLLGEVLELCRYGREKLNAIEGVYAFGREMEGKYGISCNRITIAVLVVIIR